ncbi:MAG: hypothetical protein DRO96_02985 [Candidatus Aenigmatarchaeota archaeon]|nr:MAG: hypothetical protein DRO96_02985 [Candidatus Aenigmarchaeota archaeon]
MLSPEIKRIMKENERYTQMLEYYDKTGKLPLKKIRKNFTLKIINYEKLKKASKEKTKTCLIYTN